ncbi:unnamed protein product [Ectocarpus sp. 12 AP-2014]
MGLFQVVCVGLLAVVGRAQDLQDCSGNSTLLTVGSTEDAAALASSLQCSNGDIAVEWVGEVFVEETITVIGGTSLNIAGAGSGAVADGGGGTQLFYVDGGSSLHLSDMTLSNGNASFGGAIFANKSSVSFTGSMSFVSNSAELSGGAIGASESTVSWVGNATEFSNNTADSLGGAIFAGSSSTVSWSGDGTAFSNNAAGESGGAIYATDSSTVSWDGDGTEFSHNTASWLGGAIFAGEESIVSWIGDATQFSSNLASWEGGAIFARDSNVRWDGDGTQFSSNSAFTLGGAIFALYSNLSWEGDNTRFDSSSAFEGGAVYAEGTNVSWYGDGTRFSNNSVDHHGGAIWATDSKVSWVGDDTQFNSNSANTSLGGAIFLSSTKMSWDGDGTRFSSNSAGGPGGAICSSQSSLSWDGAGTEFSSNSATGDGGAIYNTASSTVSWDGNTTFSSNIAGDNGGALAFTECDPELEYSPNIGSSFIDNIAGISGGAMYFDNCGAAINFTNVIFTSNSAAVAGGAVAAYDTGDEFNIAVFSGCIFSNNKASGTGGAVETLSGDQEFISCEFQGNSADIGGAMRLGGITGIHLCSFLSNSATRGGLAVAVTLSATISNSSFDTNELTCEAGSYRHDTTEEGSYARFEEVCLDCPDWTECVGCSVTSENVTSACETPLEHTSASEPGLTLETLKIDEGYWRATTKSDTILACYNPDACTGGQTGAASYCASGYTGPYCAVCETDYSPSLAHACTWCSSSRRQGLIAATVVTAIVAVFAVAVIFKFLSSTEAEEGDVGCFHRRVLRAVPVQALKIIVVVWQILTQFADAANVTYPGVYQDFLSVIDIVNFDLGSVLAAGCLWSDFGFHDRLLVSTLGPLVVVGFLAMTYLIAVRRNGTLGDTAVAEKILHRHQAALLLVTFVVYSSVSSTVFQTFACETLDDGIEYLRADYRIHCTDTTHEAFEVYAGFMVFVYPVGVPLLYAVLLFRRREALANASADKAVAQSIAGLWEPYKPERFYYEVVECGRRIMLTGVIVFIYPNDAAQIAITLLISSFFALVFEVLSPYKSESDTWLSRVGHVIVFLSMFDLLVLKVDVSDERAQSQAAFAGVLVAGHVLMILAIVVEAVGICYASRKTKVLEGGEEASERPRVGSDDVPVFESAPAPWRSFFRQGSVSEKAGPTRSVSEAVGRTGWQ